MEVSKISLLSKRHRTISCRNTFYKILNIIKVTLRYEIYVGDDTDKWFPPVMLFSIDRFFYKSFPKTRNFIVSFCIRRLINTLFYLY